MSALMDSSSYSSQQNTQQNTQQSSENHNSEITGSNSEFFRAAGSKSTL